MMKITSVTSHYLYSFPVPLSYLDPLPLEHDILNSVSPRPLDFGGGDWGFEIWGMDIVVCNIVVCWVWENFTFVGISPKPSGWNDAQYFMYGLGPLTNSELTRKGQLYSASMRMGRKERGNTEESDMGGYRLILNIHFARGRVAMLKTKRDPKKALTSAWQASIKRAAAACQV